MPMLPVRSLGSLGIIRDINPYDLPPPALSSGNNVRFEDGKITRQPSFREIQALTPTDPRHIFTIRIPGVSDKIGVACDDGKIYTYLNETEDEVTPVSGTVASSTLPYSHTLHAGVSYLNRSDRVPLYYAALSTDYAALTNWDTNDRCKSMRSFKDYLIALNVSKSGVSYPTMVKWSDTTLYGAVPGSWDETDPTTNAGENTLAEANTAIVDGAPLRNAFIIYTTYQAFMMTESGNLDVFNFRKLFDNRGLINMNCVVEVQGLHYCFGFNDIYVHDGSSYRSIIEGRDKDFVFGNLSYQDTRVCFVKHDPNRNEVIFGYQSGDEDCNFSNATEANKKAVYNYVSDTWSFGDFPNVVGMTEANVDNFRTYAQVSTGYDVTGGTYYELETGESQHQFTAGPALDTVVTAARLYGYDPIVEGLLPYPLSTEANSDAFAARIGIDLDETGSELRAYKVIKSIYPQLHDYGLGGISFQFAGTEYGENPVNYSAAIPWTEGQYKVDTREGGRYLAWKITCDANTDFRFSGFDADIVQTGRR